MFTCRSLKLFLAVLRSAEICFFCLYISFILKCSWSITATTRPKMKRRENKSGEIFLRNSLTYLSYASFFRFTFNFVYWHDTWSKLSFNFITIKIVFPFHFHGLEREPVFVKSILYNYLILINIQLKEICV